MSRSGSLEFKQSGGVSFTLYIVNKQKDLV